MEIRQNTVFITQKEVILKNDARAMVVNLNLSHSEETIAKLRGNLFHIQKSKTPLTPVHELNHTEHILEMVPRLDSRNDALSADSSMLIWFFGTATLLDLGELLKTVAQLHRNDGEIIHSVTHKMIYLKTLDSADKFNTEVVEILSEKVKAIMLN